MSVVYVEALFDEQDLIKVNLETLLVIYVYQICDTSKIKLNVVRKDYVDAPLFEVQVSQVNFEVIDFVCVPKLAGYCVWPVVVTENTVVAGLCSVTRQIIKSSANNAVRSLLGFKEACLLACSESSVWTKFCEVDVIRAVKSVVSNLSDYVRGEVVHLPAVLTKFEYHMRQPVKTHNIYKLAREKHNDKTIKSSVPLEDLNLAHTYGEGSYMTLADVLLFPCFKMLFDVFSIDSLESELPACLSWFKNMQSSELLSRKFEVPLLSLNVNEKRRVVQENIARESLYTSDPNRYKPQNRIYTKQGDIENSISIIDKINVAVLNDFEPFGSDTEFDWVQVPLQANPLGGALPIKRANRKCEQLENLAKAVLKLARHYEPVIVDFCSGSGHLGILLATLLPKCEVVLVENKEHSLLRAKERILNLNLQNVTLLQCNLDYFKAKFDVGVSLHACGVATDLVIQNCIKNKAHFVCCPCCYGSIHNCHHLMYPRSEEFSNSDLNYKDYLSIAHAADQTHDSDNVKTKQGFICMDIIDTDRKLQAESCGYAVYLGKLQPTSCTPKNNLLVGICSS